MAKAYVKHDYAVTGRAYVETEGGGDTPASGGSYTDEEREIGTWLDGSALYEKTYKLKLSELTDLSSTASLISGQVLLDKLNYKNLWIYDGSMFNTAPTNTYNILSVPVNYPSSGSYSRANIQINSSVNDGYPFIFYETTYGASQLYGNGLNKYDLSITVRYTKTE